MENNQEIVSLVFMKAVYNYIVIAEVSDKCHYCNILVAQVQP